MPLYSPHHMERFRGLVSKSFKRQTDGTNQPVSTYQFSPLEENEGQIRLLVLRRGKFKAKIRISLYTARLAANEIPNYEALSYVWGSTEDRVNISVQSSHRQKTSTLAVTRNLANALTYLRQQQKDRVLWIDAICINQNDLEERGRQIRRMADVYRWAQHVIVWLGEEKDDSGLALASLSMLSTKVDVSWSNFSMTPTQESEPHWADRTESLPFSNREWMAIAKLLDRAWFERLWVWQEVRLGHRDAVIMCGFNELPWQAFRYAGACLYVKIHPNFGTNTSRFLENLRRTVDISKSGSFAFRALAEMTRNSKCADPKDRIFSMLSICGTKYSDDLDYTKSVVEIYRDFFVLDVQISGVLGLLGCCERGSDYLNLPSWVPDWSPPKVSLNFPNTQASLLSMANVSFNVGIMTATGVHLATINQVCSSNIIEQNDVNSVVLELRRLVDELQIRARLMETKSYLDTFCRTICANACSDKYYPPRTAFNAPEDLVPAVMWALNRLSGEAEAWEEDLPYNQYWFLQQGVSEWLLGRSLFTTCDSHLGLAPGATQSGDLMVVLLGCNVPIVLRPSSQGMYEVIGEAYCHEFMNGETLLGALPENVEFVLQTASDGNTRWECIDRRSGIILREDPRLGHLPPGWHSEKREAGMVFWNDDMRETEGTWDDPRMTPEALRQRGVELQTFELE